MISDLAHEYTRLKLRQQGSSDQQPIREMVHQMELRIDAQDANTSLVNAEDYKWKMKTSKARLDSGADAHIWIHPAAYITLEPPVTSHLSR